MLTAGRDWNAEICLSSKCLGRHFKMFRIGQNLVKENKYLALKLPIFVSAA
jgi:hypothetical protein